MDYFVYKLKDYFRVVKLLVNSILIFIISQRVTYANQNSNKTQKYIVEATKVTNSDEQDNSSKANINLTEARADISETYIESADILPKKTELEDSSDLVYYEKIFNECMATYPELKHLKISLRDKALRTSMQVRPTALSVFNKKKNRKYIIWVDSVKLNMLHSSADQRRKMLVGAMGHELAHILDYNSKNGFAVTFMGVKYLLSKKYKIAMENETDSVAAAKGFGEELIMFNKCIANHKKLPARYIKIKKKYYLSAAQIQRQIADNN